MLNGHLVGACTTPVPDGLSLYGPIPAKCTYKRVAVGRKYPCRKKDDDFGSNYSYLQCMNTSISSV